MRLVAAPTRACTGRRLTFQRRLVTLWAWLMRFPDCGFLPQISHCCAMTAIDPFRGLDGNFYSTGFRPWPTIRPGCGWWVRMISAGLPVTRDPWHDGVSDLLPENHKIGVATNKALILKALGEQSA